MSKLFQNENEKNKEIKETSETESYDYYENEAVENAEEGSFPEEALFSKDSLPSGFGQTVRSISSSEKETELERHLRGSESRRLLMEKWFSVAGKKPRNIPVVKKYFDEVTDKIIFFGDRGSENMDKKRAERLFLEAKRLRQLKITYGKVRLEVRMPPLCRGLSCVRFAPDGRFLAVADLSGVVQIRHSFSGEVTMNLKTIEQNENLAINSLKYFPGDDKKLFLGGESGVIQVFNPQSGELLGISNNLGMINVMDVVPSGSILACGGIKGTVCTVDPLTLQTVWKTTWPRVDKITSKVEDQYHKLRIYALKFHPTEISLFATGGCDDSIKIWDVRISKAIRSIRGPVIYGEGVDLLGDRIITASWRTENSLSLWNFSSGRLIKNIPIRNKITKYESEFLYCAQFFKSSSVLDSFKKDMIAVGGGGFNELLVINVETEKILAYFPSFKSTLTLDICGNAIAYGGKKSTFRMGEVESKRINRPLLR